MEKWPNPRSHWQNRLMPSEKDLIPAENRLILKILREKDSLD